MPDPEKETEELGRSPRKGARAKIIVEGNVTDEAAEKAMRAAGGAEAATAVARRVQTFATVIRGLENRIVAQRIAPPTTLDGVPLGDSYEINPTDDLTERDVAREIQDARGGNKWNVRVFGPDGNVLASKTLNVPGPARPDPMADGFGNEQQPAGEEPPPEPTPEEQEAALAAQLEADPEVVEARKRERLDQLDVARMRREAEKEEYQARMDEAKAQRERTRRAMSGQPENGASGKGGDLDSTIQRAIEAATGPLKEQNATLQRQLEERSRREDQQRAMDAQTGPLKQMLEAQQRALDEITRKLNAPPAAPQGPSTQDILSKLDAVKAEIKLETDRQIAATLGSLSSKYDNQFQNILTQLGTLANRPQDGGTLASTAVSALKDIAVAQRTGGAPSDPIETTSKVIGLVKNLGEMTGMGSAIPRDFPTMVVERVTDLAPQVLDFIERQRAANKGADEIKADVQKMFKDYGLKMWQELDRTIKTEVRGALGQRRPAPAPALPAAAPSAAQGPPPPGVVAPPAGPVPGVSPGVATAPAVVRFAVPQAAPGPSPVPVAAQQQPGAAAPAPPPAGAPQFGRPLDQEIRARVNWLLGILHKEIQLGVQRMTWPEKAYENLPKDIVDRIVTAATDRDLYEAVKPWADPNLLDAIWAQLADSHPNHDYNREWITAGINWIKDAATGNLDEGGVVEDTPAGQ